MCNLDSSWWFERVYKKIENSKITTTDEWTDGLNTGLDWALRILNQDKSAD